MTLTGLAAVAVLNVIQVSSYDKNVFCGNLENVVFDHELPINHPVNKCAVQQSQGVSWTEWFTGRSSSYQFHFIDLLELLYRSGNSDTKNPANAQLSNVNLT